RHPRPGAAGGAGGAGRALHQRGHRFGLLHGSRIGARGEAPRDPAGAARWYDPRRMTPDPDLPTPIHRQRIEHPSAWRGGDFRSKDEVAFDLAPRHVQALEEILARTAALPRDAIAREHCGHPALDRDLAGVYRELMSGRGLVVVRGFPVAG